MKAVSVIIPIEKENENLRRCLEGLEKQSYRDFEVVVVGSKITNPKSQILNKFQTQNLKLKIINKPELVLKPAAKRNWGAKNARGEILAFLDDDCVPERDWIEGGVRSLGDRGGKGDKGDIIGAVVGPMLTPPDSPFLERAAGYLWESPIISPINIMAIIKIIKTILLRKRVGDENFVEDWPSANFFIRKADFLKLGGFDERFWPGEDTKLCLDIVRRGGKIRYDPGVVVYHRRRPLFRPFLEQAARYGRQRGRFARLFPQTSRKWTYFMPSIFLGYLGGLGILGGLGTSTALSVKILGIYLVIIIIESFRIFVKEKNVLMIAVFIIGVFLTHVVYGVSFIRGMLGKV